MSEWEFHQRLKGLEDRVLQLELQLSVMIAQHAVEATAKVRVVPEDRMAAGVTDTPESGDLSDEEPDLDPTQAFGWPVTDEDLDRIVNGASEESDLDPDEPERN